MAPFLEQALAQLHCMAHPFCTAKDKKFSSLGLTVPSLPQVRDGTFRRQFLVQALAQLHFMAHPFSTAKDKNAILATKFDGLEALNDRVSGGWDKGTGRGQHS